jgi:DNA-binding NtrC family response regulator
MSVEHSPKTDQSARRRAVLLVDDDRAVRDFVRTALAHAGYAVTPVPDAAQALDVFRAAPKQFDLILSDGLMPGRSGLELAGDLRAIAPEVRILLMSGFAAGHDGRPVNGTHSDGIEILNKPFTIDGLLAAVARALTV